MSRNILSEIRIFDPELMKEFLADFTSGPRPTDEDIDCEIVNAIIIQRNPYPDGATVFYYTFNTEIPIQCNADWNTIVEWARGHNIEPIENDTSVFVERTFAVAEPSLLDEFFDEFLSWSDIVAKSVTSVVVKRSDMYPAECSILGITNDLNVVLLAEEMSWATLVQWAKEHYITVSNI